VKLYKKKGIEMGWDGGVVFEKNMKNTGLINAQNFKANEVLFRDNKFQELRLKIGCKIFLMG